MINLLFFLNLLTPNDGWHSWCERHIVAEDPYQFEHLSTDQIVTAYLNGFQSKAMVNEIRKRLREPGIDYETHEILSKLIGEKK